MCALGACTGASHATLLCNYALCFVQGRLLLLLIFFGDIVCSIQGMPCISEVQDISSCFEHCVSQTKDAFGCFDVCAAWPSLQSLNTPLATHPTIYQQPIWCRADGNQTMKVYNDHLHECASRHVQALPQETRAMTPSCNYLGVTMLLCNHRLTSAAPG